MAGNNLNQIVLDAFRQANGNMAAGSDVHALVQELLPQTGDSFSSSLSDASRQIDSLKSAIQVLAVVVNKNSQAVTQNSAAQSGGRKASRGAGSSAG